MSLKAELETWAAALKAYDDQDFDKSLQLFATIGDSSKILTNMGLIYATLGEHEAAVEQFIGATQLDQYLAVAYFQCGVSNFLLSRYEMAHKDFEEAVLYLRGNQAINYEQLGLKFKLFSAEILFNKGLSQIFMGRLTEGLQDLDDARREKATAEHNVIDDAIMDRGEGYTVFSIPVGVLYRPSESKLKNAKARDFLGKAKLVATSDENEAYTTFSGVTRLKQGILPSGAYQDGTTPDPNLNRAATVAVTSRPTVPDEDRPVPLQRAKTTITVPTDARDRIRGVTSPSSVSPSAQLPGPGLSRNPSSATSGSRGMTARGLSVRRPGMPAPTLPGVNMAGAGTQNPNRPSPTDRVRTPTGNRPTESRVTDFYDNYMDAYADNAQVQSAPPLGRNPSRVSNWARNNANPLPPLPGSVAQRSMPPPSSYAPSSAGGGMRRKSTRRVPRAKSMYEEEEEGYGSGGDYEDTVMEMSKIRIKLHYQEDVRGMAIDADLPFEEFANRITTKFGRSFEGLQVKFKDEDGGKVSLRDEMDYDLAIETARESAKGKAEGRLEFWLVDV